MTAILVLHALQRMHGTVDGDLDGHELVLRDGSVVRTRAVRPSDATLLADGFARLSARSRQSRFLTGKPTLSPAELRYFTDVDHRDHEAIGALSDGRGIGVARYVRDREDPYSADLAVTVVDEWQGRGLGPALVTELSRRARQEGISRFTALVSADNDAALRALARRGSSVALIDDDGFGALEFAISLGEGPDDVVFDQYDVVFDLGRC